MKIAFIGSRGIPAQYGGFETFVEEVADGLAKYPEVEVTVVCDKFQRENFSKSDYKGIKLLYSKYSKAETPNLYYWDSIKKVMNDVDIIYSCGVGGAFTSWIPRVKGVKFVTNPDGMGWWRSKWSFTTKIALYTMFWLSTKTSEYFVNDSREIMNEMKQNFNRKKRSTFIEYGAHENIFLENDNNVLSEHLEKYNIKSNQYHLVVSRLEPENNVHIIVEGYLKTNHRYPLIIVGNLQDTEYVKSLQAMAINNSKIKFVGGIYDRETLQAIRYASLTYLHGHSVGGTNPSLLEALASKNLCICHDNPFNREVTDNNSLYFSDSYDVSNHLKEVEGTANDDKWRMIRQKGYERIQDYYNWPSIIKRYYKYFKELHES
ncbi:DUF1972 domain-containing protein [Gracilimonas sp. Q87]|uniref:DUF1972 domain-containing protein n=1 Tax=Gracilimonas sp. Q87 TaxID=3384766 RepID=UPI00398425A1